MTIKEKAIKTIRELPDDATWEDIQDRIDFMAALRKGLRELDKGKGIPHAQVKQDFARWFSS